VNRVEDPAPAWLDNVKTLLELSIWLGSPVVALNTPDHAREILETPTWLDKSAVDEAPPT
jgi:hypothetical protein